MWANIAGSRASRKFFVGPIAACAIDFAGGETTRNAVKWRQTVDPTRLLMTFLETAAFNDRYKEAEAVLLGDPSNPAF